jgi:hypothetical protein
MRSVKPLSLAAVLLLPLCGCGVFHGSVRDPAVDQARAELNQLQADPQLSSQAPVAMREAEDAVKAAEEPQKDAKLSAHLAYLAERKVQTARELAQARIAEDQLKGLQ